MTDCKCEDWKAYHDHMPPGPATLRVTATCSCPPGRTLELRRKEVQGINERDLLLELTEVEQDGDGELEYREDTDMRYDTVSILPDGPYGIEVEIVS
jgi:hypothetical protein